jgi:hypothetical protein
MFPGALPLPYRQLLAVLNSSQFSVAYKGILQIDGRSAHDIQVQRVRPGNVDSNGFFSEYHTRDFFIDPSSLQVLMIQDVVPKHIVHQIRYSNYAPVSGVLAPFSINEQMGGQQTWTIHLSQISINTGLPASAFALQ